MSGRAGEREKVESARERKQKLEDPPPQLTPLVLKVPERHDQPDPVGLGRRDHLVEPLQRRLVEHPHAGLDRVGRLGALVAAEAVEVGRDPDDARALVGLDAEELRDVGLGEVGPVDEVDGVGPAKIPGLPAERELGPGGLDELGGDGLVLRRVAGVGVAAAVGRGVHLGHLHGRRRLLGLGLHRRGLRGHGHRRGRRRGGRRRSSSVLGSRDAAGDERGRGGDERSGGDAAEDRGTLLLGGLGCRRRGVNASHACCCLLVRLGERETLGLMFMVGGGG